MNRPTFKPQVAFTIYVLALAISISSWFFAIRAPLWLDETGTFWQINSGFSKIWPRQYVCLAFPLYSYILWLSTQLIGFSEIALRVPSIIAMLGAVYLVYLIARDIFDREIGIITAIIFSLNPIVIFESIDVRPYAFAVLAVNATILVLLRLRNSNSSMLAALFGLLAAGVIYFHFLFAVILPAVLLSFIASKTGQRRVMWKQSVVASTVFVLAFLPLIPGLHYLFRTAKTHVFEQAPNLGDLVWTLAAPPLGVVLFLTALTAIAVTRNTERVHIARWQILFCSSLALIPIFILYGVSAATPIHLFAARHRLVAIPGVALCWAMLLSPFRSRFVRLLFCLLLVSSTFTVCLRSPESMRHGYTWKYALEIAEKNAVQDNAPVLICSDFPEADYVTMPLESPQDNLFYSQLSYYKLSVRVVPLPRALNDEAIRVGSLFLREATQKHERFLALAFMPSYPTLDWLAQNASNAYSFRVLGVYDGIKVLEFVLRNDLAPENH